MALKEVAKAVGSQPTGPSETPVGGAPGDAERDPRGAQASMAAAGRRSAPLGAWRGHMARGHGCGKMPRPPGPNRQAHARCREVNARCREVEATGVRRETPEEHLRAWPPAGEAHRFYFGGDGGHRGPPNPHSARREEGQEEKPGRRCGWRRGRRPRQGGARRPGGDEGGGEGEGSIARIRRHRGRCDVRAVAEMPLGWSTRTYAWRARWARARARTDCAGGRACAQRGRRRENGSRGQEEGGGGGGAGWSSPLRTGRCTPWRASAWRGRGWQGNLLVPGISAGARRGGRPRGHEQGHVRGLAGGRGRGLVCGRVCGLACGRRRGWPGARRGVVGGRGRCMASGAGQRIRADCGGSSCDLRPGGAGQGREEMKIGWGGRRRRGRSSHGRRRLSCRRRRLERTCVSMSNCR
ncbi:hypothetical protein BDA96_03G210200 [Sorghum bicolor]|uniref:Uncharacterized protein n=2 Tax=Sorghum bicolor TaxID=4558 RepID=A0A921RE57_SORBI|nr:hypothetical protein BDA96_03G210200 [Sorghum bicolor]KXG32753.1 hypothetical protein SORBI_3003G193900 [Sorghum bicolor]